MSISWLDGIGAWIEERAEHFEDFYDEVYGIDLDLDDGGWYDDGFFFGAKGFEDFDQEAESVEQEAESGDVSQSFDVSSTGDSSNQTVGTQGVANTGNAQNVTDVTQLDAQEGDFDDSDRERFFNDGFDFFRAGWRAAKVGARQLASLLLGPLRDVGCVALDPLEKPFGNPKGLHSGVPRGAITRREAPSSPLCVTKNT